MAMMILAFKDAHIVSKPVTSQGPQPMMLLATEEEEVIRECVCPDANRLAGWVVMALAR